MSLNFYVNVSTIIKIFVIKKLFYRHMKNAKQNTEGF